MTTTTIKHADASGLGKAYTVRPRTRPIGIRLGKLFTSAVRRAIEQALGATAWGKPPRGMTVRTAFVLYLVLTLAFALLLFEPLLWD